MKKTLKSIFSGVVLLSLLAGCTTSPDQTSNSTSGNEQNSDSEILRVSVVQYVEHTALDASYQGFVDGLAAAGYVDGENIIIDYQNAQGEQANCSTIATKFVSDGSDLILAIATPAAQAAANATTDIPIIITAVTDPASSKLVASNEAPGGNVTGTSDLTPVAEQLELLTKLAPEAKTVGILYSSSESNSTYQVEIAKEAALALGLEAIEYTVSNTNDVQQVVESMIGKVDAIYSPTDNVIANAAATVSMIATANKLPYVAGEGALVDKGALATYGISYYDLGKLTGEMAAEILAGAKPAEMPIRYVDKFDLIINEEAAAELGITIPEGL